MVTPLYYPSELPSNRLELINSLVGRKINEIIKHSSDPTDIWISDSSFKPWELFSLAMGPALIYFEDGLILAGGSQPSLNSVEIWVAKNEVGDEAKDFYDSLNKLNPINALDNQFSTPIWKMIVGQKISEVNIIKCKPRKVRYEGLPNEVGLSFILDNGQNFLFSHGLHDASDDFSVITVDQISDFFDSKLYVFGN